MEHTRIYTSTKVSSVLLDDLSSMSSTRRTLIEISRCFSTIQNEFLLFVLVVVIIIINILIVILLLMFHVSHLLHCALLLLLAALVSLRIDTHQGGDEILRLSILILLLLLRLSHYCCRLLFSSMLLSLQSIVRSLASKSYDTTKNL